MPFLVLLPSGKNPGFANGFCVRKYTVNRFVNYWLYRFSPIGTLVIMNGRALCSTVLGIFLEVILFLADGLSSK